MMDFIVFSKRRSDHRCQHILKPIFNTRWQSSLDLYSQLSLGCLLNMSIDYIVDYEQWGKATVALTRYKDTAFKAYGSCVHTGFDCLQS